MQINNNDYERLIVKINKKIENYGIEEQPRNDEYLDYVYLYDENKKTEDYEARKFIIPRLKAIAANACWIYIFYKFTPQSNSIEIDIEAKLEEIREKIIEYFKSKLREKLLEQYPHLNKSSP